MPNWCTNLVRITGCCEDIQELSEWLEAHKGRGWFDYFYPMPTDLPETGWIDWAIENWGVKWNPDAEDIEVYLSEDESSIEFRSQTAWGPPIRFYDRIHTDTFYGIQVGYVGEFEESAGWFQDGVDHCYDLEEDREGFQRDAPEEYRDLISDETEDASDDEMDIDE